MPVALQAGGKYADASLNFGGVPEQSPHYEEAQYRRVQCLRLAYEADSKTAPPAAAEQLRVRALSVARELATYAERAYQRRDSNRESVPPYELGRPKRWSARPSCSCSGVIGQNQQALDLLAGFEQHYAESRQIGRVLAVRITAYRAMLQYDRAAQVVDQFLSNG